MRSHLIRLATVAFLAAGCNGPTATEPTSAEDYVRIYGGQAGEYRAILKESSCGALQDRLYDATKDGVFGYQKAIMARGHALGCPDFALSSP